MTSDSAAVAPPLTEKPRGKILVIRGGAIGDFILTLPVFTALRRHFRETRLEVLGYPHIAQLALAGGLVDAVHSIEARALAGFFARRGQLDECLAGYFSGFAVILSFLYDPDGIFRENVACCSKAQFIAGLHRPDERLNRHATEVLLEPLARLAIFNPDPVPRLTLAEPPASGQVVPRPCGLTTGVVEFARPADRDACDGGESLALHPGSGSEKKNWPEERWRETILHLLDNTDLRFLLVGGEAEGDRLKRLSAIFPAARIQVAQNLSLIDLAKRLKRCVGFVGHDSGITHLAAALGLPGLVLWGDTNESIWRPRGERMVLLRHPQGLAQIPVEQVIGQLRGLLPASGV